MSLLLPNCLQDTCMTNLLTVQFGTVKLAKLSLIYLFHNNNN